MRDIEDPVDQDAALVQAAGELWGGAVAGAMRLAAVLVAMTLVVLAYACGPIRPVPSPPPVSIATRPVAVYALAGADVELDAPGFEHQHALADEHGRAGFRDVPVSVGTANLFIVDARLARYANVIDLPPCPTLDVWAVPMPGQSPCWTQAPLIQSLHVDPSTIPLTTLAQIRGSMWTARLNLPFGPRPNQDDNILAMDFYPFYGAADRKRMIDAYKGDGYTHAVTGPLSGTDCYHGQYPCHEPDQAAMMPTSGAPTQAQFDAYLDAMQEWWDAGITPIHFAHPDGLDTPDDMAALDALYRQPRAQKLLRVVVYTGWEPTQYGWPNALWVRWVQRGADVFPNALRLVHTVCDTDALTGGDDDQRLPGGNAEAWRRTVPYLHGWLVQNCGYVFGPSDAPTPEFLKNFTDQFNPNVNGSLRRRFERAYAGWPTGSAWGSDKPLLVYPGEYAAYRSYWRNSAERYSQDLGDAAIRAGAQGYLDGGRLPVPEVVQ